MTMLKTFNLKGEKLSFADWISNLSPCETPFVSMIPKEKVDQTMYQWQTDRLTQPMKRPEAGKNGNPDEEDKAFEATDFKEGSTATMDPRFHTKVWKNYTQIFRKAVRVSDTTKKISLYGRNSELSYQLEKAGMELKRDLEFTILNSIEVGRQGTEGAAGVFAGFQKLVAPIDGKCYDTGAKVHKAVNYTKVTTAGERQIFFTKAQVFDLTYNLYLAGARANKIMFHPMHMGQFSDWVGDLNPKAGATLPNPHLHRMFDGMEEKYNAFVKKIRDPLGQEFTLIPNRHMPKDMLFFFNESDWSQMVLREPQKVVLAKMGSSEKHMIEMEVGLRHRNPFASGILEFHETSKTHVKGLTVTPFQAAGDSTEVATVTGKIYKADGTPDASSTTPPTITATGLDGGTDAVTVGTVTTSAGVFTAKLKAGTSSTDKKSGRTKIKATTAANDVASAEASASFYAD